MLEGSLNLTYKTPKYVSAICYCENCDKSFILDIKTDLSTFMNELSKNGCIYCEVTEDAKPRIHILKIVSEDESAAQELVENSLTKYCEFENDITEGPTQEQEYYNSLCHFIKF